MFDINQVIPTSPIPPSSQVSQYNCKMPDSKLKPAILIVSDTASQNPSTDKSIDALSTLLASEGVNTWDEPVTKIVPDNVIDIQRAICAWTDGSEWVNLILVSGGTGFAVKDYTPEVCLPSLVSLGENVLMPDRLCHPLSIDMLRGLCECP